MVPFGIMNTFTLRLEDRLAKKLDKICRLRGFKKTGLIKSLVQNFVAKEEEQGVVETQKFRSLNLRSLVNIVSLGGDAVEDCENLYDE
jgi:hypothetical protein